MKKIILLLFLAYISTTKIFADEGMWLPSLIKERVSDMQKKGFRLTSEDIYSVNQACLKDAIVHFGSGTLQTYQIRIKSNYAHYVSIFRQMRCPGVQR